MRILQIIVAAPGWYLVYADTEHRGKIDVDPIACWALIEHDDVQSIIPGVGSAEWSCVDLAACRCRNVIGIMPPGDTYDSWEQASADWYDRAREATGRAGGAE